MAYVLAVILPQIDDIMVYVWFVISHKFFLHCKISDFFRNITNFQRIISTHPTIYRQLPR